MSEVKVNKISPRSGTTVTLGDSGDTFSIASGASLSGFTSTGIDDNASSTAITIDSSQNVGIGVTSMTNKLVLPNAAYFAMRDTSNLESLAIRANTSNAMEILTNGSVKMVIDSSGRVGIGVTPNTAVTTGGLHVHGTGNPVIRITNSVTGTGTTDGLIVGNSGGDTSDFQVSNYENGFLSFGTNATERMRIDSSGNVLVGTTTNSNSGQGINIRANGIIKAGATSSEALNLFRLSTDGDIVSFYKDGTTVGSIHTRSSNLSIGSVDTGLEFNQANDIIFPANPSTNNTRDNAIDLGSGAVRFKNLYLSGSVYLGGTGAANALDDYEEGTYTVVVSSTGGQTATLNTSFDTCSYTKIGRVVHARGFIRPTGWDATPSGNIKISLPFANQDLSEESERGAVACHIANTGINLGDWIGLITGANSFFYIYRGNTDSLSVGDSSTYLGSGDDIHFSITYQTGS